MKYLPLQGRTLALVVVIVPLIILFVYVTLRSGPLAPVAVTVTHVESRGLSPGLFGIGTVEARYKFKVGPIVTGRLKHLDTNVGDRVIAGQVLGEMDPVDLDARVQSQESSSKRAEAAVREAVLRKTYAETQAQRYEQLFAVGSTSDEILFTKRQELKLSYSSLTAAREDLARIRSDRDALVAQRNNLRLIAPVDGVVVWRDADPGTTVIAGQTIVEIIDPESIWINVRFDQISASGLAAGLPGRITLRSRADQILNGRVLRVEPKADAVTEEILAKVVFDKQPESLPAIGELAEVTVDLPGLPSMPVISNAAVRREGDKVGVWQVLDGNLHFSFVKLGASDLDGNVQVLEGLKADDQIVIHSEKLLTPRSRIQIVERIAGTVR